MLLIEITCTEHREICFTEDLDRYSLNKDLVHQSMAMPV